MRIIERYIGTTVLWSVAMIFFIFLGLTLFVTFVSELSDIGTADYGVWQAFVYVLRLMPHQIYSVFPVIILIGSLMGLGVLANHSELVVMRASGLSILQMMAAILRIGVVLLVVITLMGEVAGPYLKRLGDVERELLESGGQTLDTNQGVWVRSLDNFIHISEVLDHEHFRHVTVYQFDKHHRLSLVISAERAEYVNGHWWMYDIEQSVFEGERVTSQHTREAVWSIDLKPDLFQMGFVEAGSMNLVRLWYFIQYREMNGLQSSTYTVEFWKRVYQPLATLVMMFLAIPFIFFGSSRSVTMGFRIVLGIIVGVLFFIFNELLGQISVVYRIPAPIAAFLPILLFAGIGVLMVRRVR